jgi:chromosome segregation ATPase
LELADILKLLAVFLAGAGGGYVKDIFVEFFKARTGRAAAGAGVEQKKIETEPSLLQEVREQLRECRRSEEELQRQLFKIKSNMQTMWLALELILKRYPEAEGDVRAAIRQMRERQEDFLNEEGGPHETRTP